MDLGAVVGDTAQAAALRRADLDRERGLDLREQPLDRRAFAGRHLPIVVRQGVDRRSVATSIRHVGHQTSRPHL